MGGAGSGGSTGGETEHNWAGGLEEKLTKENGKCMLICVCVCACVFPLVSNMQTHGCGSEWGKYIIQTERGSSLMAEWQTWDVTEWVQICDTHTNRHTHTIVTDLHHPVRSLTLVPSYLNNPGLTKTTRCGPLHSFWESKTEHEHLILWFSVKDKWKRQRSMSTWQRGDLQELLSVVNTGWDTNTWKHFLDFFQKMMI